MKTDNDKDNGQDIDIMCPECGAKTWVNGSDKEVGVRKGMINAHCTDPLQGEESRCPMSGQPYQPPAEKSPEAEYTSMGFPPGKATR